MAFQYLSAMNFVRAALVVLLLPQVFSASVGTKVGNGVSIRKATDAVLKEYADPFTCYNSYSRLTEAEFGIVTHDCCVKLQDMTVPARSVIDTEIAVPNSKTNQKVLCGFATNADNYTIDHYECHEMIEYIQEKCWWNKNGSRSQQGGIGWFWHLVPGGVGVRFTLRERAG